VEREGTGVAGRTVSTPSGCLELVSETPSETLARYSVGAMERHTVRTKHDYSQCYGTQASPSHLGYKLKGRVEPDDVVSRLCTRGGIIIGALVAVT
jgi:hypothetical protein